ncbi:MAG: hypothetical protein V8R26_04055 [Clostridia bacterium]
MINDIFDNNISFVDYSRSGIVYYTEDLDELYNLTKKGWKFYCCNKGFRLTPPEESIVDITNYDKSIQYQNLDFNLIYYKFLKKLLENNKLNSYINIILQENEIFYKDFKYLISSGPVLETEIRIFGSDKRIKKLKIDMVNKFINSKNYQDSRNKLNLKLLETKNIPLSKRAEKEKVFFEEIKRKVSLIRDSNTYNEKIYKIYNMQLIENDNFDIYIFVPFGCFKYLSSFITIENVEKIMFWEEHAEKTRTNTFKLFSKDLKNKKILIIDNIYSGKTLEKLKTKIRIKGGIPYVLGLNPKNKNNILTSDYIMILNHIYKRNDLNIEKKDFFENMYKKILKEG